LAIERVPELDELEQVERRCWWSMMMKKRKQQRRELTPWTCSVELPSKPDVRRQEAVAVVVERWWLMMMKKRKRQRRELTPWTCSDELPSKPDVRRQEAVAVEEFDRVEVLSGCWQRQQW
jgi:hypothetical protein